MTSRDTVLLALLAAASISAVRAADEASSPTDGLSGGWGGRRSALEDRGLTPFLNYTLDGLSVAKGGYEKGQAVVGVVDFGIDIALSHTPASLPGTLRLEALYFHGDDPTAELVGDFNYLNNIVGATGIRLYQVVYSVEHKAWTLGVGLTAVDEVFGNAENAVIFVNSAFGPIPTLTWNSGLAIWPLNALGATAGRKISEHSFVTFGVYDGTAAPDGESDRGTNVRWSNRDGVLAIAEWGLSWSEDAQAGALRLGTWWHTGEFTDYFSDESRDRNHGFHVILEQALDSAAHWNAFARVGYAPRDDRNYIEIHVDLGFTASGAVINRPDDLLGVAFFHSALSKGYLASRAAAGDRVSSHEAGVELTYSLGLGRGVWLQPDFQYLFAAHETDKDAAVFILRLYAEF